VKPYYEDDLVKLYHGDCLDVLRAMPDASVDSIVTDPPYGLGFMGREWDALPPGLPWAQECLRVLKPGGHLLAFGGTRTWHRLACAVEDAGFEVRDSIAWMYGSGFPKSLDVSKAIDKLAGAEREVVGKRTDGRYAYGFSEAAKDNMRGLDPTATGFTGEVGIITAPATPDAERWQGWGTALKPAHEPVVCARKPFNVVPLDWRLVANVHHALAGLLWLSLSPAKRVELSSPSSQVERDGAWCASALVSVALDTSRDGYDETATYNSPATASTSLSIASSWSSILGALSAPTRTFTTSTASSTTTALRTLNSLLAPITSQTTMPPCGCLLGGSASTVASVESSSTDEWASWLHTLSASAPESAIEGIAVAAASVCAQVAESLSDDLEAGSSAAPSATTGADASSSPAFEPVVVARKPLSGTVASNVLAHGTGALNIAATRVGTDGGTFKASKPEGASNGIYGHGINGTVEIGTLNAGRWPANVILDESQAAALDEMSGESKSPTIGSVANTKGGNTIGTFAHEGRAPSPNGHGDSGGASRFFYVAKADTSERVRVDGIAHPTVKPLALMRWLVRLVTPPGGTVLEPFAGSGTTVEACLLEGFRCVAIEREADYLPLIVQRINRRRDPVAAVKAAGDDAGLFDLLDGAAS
jgi:hypothetical protein